MKKVTSLIFASLLIAPVVPGFGQQLRESNGTSRAQGLKLPAIVDGVHYEPDEVQSFKGQTMYWVYDEAAREKGVIFGFTSPEAVQEYGRESQKARDKNRPSLITSSAVQGNSSCSFLHPAVNAGPGDPYDWLVLCPLQQISMLRDGYNDRLSYIEAGSGNYYTVLYKCYNFSAAAGCDILWVGPGNTISDLNAYNMNNVTSSIRFCRNVDPFSCLQ